MTIASPLNKSPMSILVVEDEMLVAMGLETILEDLGHTVIGPIMSLRDLESLFETGFHADAAILDVNIAGRNIFPWARRMIDRGIPVVFATGYGESGLSEDLSDLPVVPKPYSETDIATTLQAIAAAGGRPVSKPVR